MGIVYKYTFIATTVESYHCNNNLGSNISNGNNKVINLQHGEKSTECGKAL